ncbi:hypothetical protein IFR05_014074 [Cadophora sp. M221]|nr:hypothetical protein IFR05_014074 [Cadophora sp. M221]
MSSHPGKAKARVVSANRLQPPLSEKAISPNGIQKRKSAVGLTESSKGRKRSKPDSLGQDSIGVSSFVSVRNEAIELSAANSSSRAVVEQLQAQLLKLVKDQAEDRARFQSKLDTQDGHLQQLQTTLDGHDYRNNDDGEVSSEGSALDIYNASPEPPRNVSSVSTHSSIVLQQRSAFEEDGNLPPAERRIVAFYDGMQMPYVIRELAPCEYFRLPTNPNEKFSHEFLKKVLGGSPISNRCYKIPTKNRTRRAFPEIDVYRVLKAEHEPLLPRYPGQHGAQLSWQFSDDNIETDFPLFICDRGARTGYRYYGTYREPRASDIVGGSEMCYVPDHVKQCWAKQLGMQTGNGKSRSALNILIHEWPRVSVGWKEESTGELIEYDVALEAELGGPITRAITADEAAEITEDEVLEAFNRVWPIVTRKHPFSFTSTSSVWGMTQSFIKNLSRSTVNFKGGSDDRPVCKGTCVIQGALLVAFLM